MRFVFRFSVYVFWITEVMSMARVITIRTYKAMNEKWKAGCHPELGCVALIMRWAKKRLMSKSKTTPAETKTLAAIATLTL